MNRRHGIEAEKGLGGGQVSPESQRNLEIAEDLCRRRKPEQAVPYLTKALKDPNNLDALIQVAFLSPNPAVDGIEALEEAESRGRRIIKKALGSKAFDDDGGIVGKFWVHVETRPFMRVLQALVRFYYEMCKNPAKSARTCEEMLRLQPSDHMGERYWLGSMLNHVGRHSDALFFSQSWLTERTRQTGEPPLRGGTAYAASSPAVPSPIKEDDLKWTSASHFYTAALSSFKVFGDCEQSRAYLQMAAISNPLILLKILARIKPPSGLNMDGRQPNGAEDAQDYLFMTQKVWMEDDVWEWANATHAAKNTVLKLCSRSECGIKETRVAEFKRCAACHLVSYCGQACQKKDWPSHKPDCHAHKVQKASLRAFNLGKPAPADAPLIFASDISGGSGKIYSNQ